MPKQVRPILSVEEKLDLIQRVLKVEPEVAKRLLPWLNTSLREISKLVTQGSFDFSRIGVERTDSRKDLGEKIVVYILLIRRQQISKACTEARAAYLRRKYGRQS